MVRILKNQLLFYIKIIILKDYGISLSTINKWVKQYSEIKTEDGDVFTTKQIKELQKRNALFRRKSNFFKRQSPSSLRTQTKIKCYLTP